MPDPVVSRTGPLSCPAPRPRTRWFTALWSLLPLTALWWIIAGGAAGSWIIGVPAILAAAWAVARLGTGVDVRLSMAGWLRFLPFFLWESLLGGVDVARRTLERQVRVAPGFLHYETRLADPAARVFLTNCVCLVPGTLAAELEGDRLTVHVLSTEMDSDVELRRLEQAVARLFCEHLEGVR